MSDRLTLAVRSYFDGSLSEEELEWLDGQLTENESAREVFLREANLIAGLEEIASQVVHGTIRREEGSVPSQSTRRSSSSRRSSSGSLAMLSGWAIAAAALLFLWWDPFTSGRPEDADYIAKVTALSGPFQWTGDGGEVRSDLSLGMQLAGGTIDGLSPDSRFTLQFKDGTELFLSGDATLVFSDKGQKILHLKSGSLAADVQPQPAGQPMMLYSRSAVMEVLGTAFEVDADVSSTALKVTEGEVRIERLSDGQSVSVPASHRVLAAADRELTVEQSPPIVTQWRSRLDTGPDDTSGRWVYGRWAMSGKDGLLYTIPFMTEDRKTIFASALQVSKADSEAVITAADTQVHVRGQLDALHPVFIGLTLRTPEGEFGGRYQTILSQEYLSQQFETETFPILFDVEIPLAEFQLDPSLESMRQKLPKEKVNLVVESAWSHSLFKAVGLAVAEFKISD